MKRKLIPTDKKLLKAITDATAETMAKYIKEQDELCKEADKELILIEIAEATKAHERASIKLNQLRKAYKDCMGRSLPSAGME